MARTIIDFLTASTARVPARVAVEEPPDFKLNYAELDALSDQARDGLRALGVERGDRVGIYLRKSIDAYAAILGALKAGAAYVPIDPAAPPWRSAYVAHNCGVRVLVIDRSLTAAWRLEAAALGALPSLLELSGVGGGRALRTALESVPPVVDRSGNEAVGPDDLAYVLYTSGSTGKPKGVMLSHACATDHVDWYSEVFGPTEHDRFSSHAPFHFDLSITDLYVPLKHGSTVVLIDADHGKEPLGLAELIAARRLTIWYSTPTILTMMAEFGRMQSRDYSALRHVLFAGEVFPVKHLRVVKALLPDARFFNLYGPTETNVCTWCEIPAAIDARRTEPFPIGLTCSHFQSRVVDEHGSAVERGAQGELVIHGRGMLQGYYADPDRTAAAFFVDAEGRRWYRTGDVVHEAETGQFAFDGRRDRMVKRKGYRIELGEIEAGLFRHTAVKEAAVVAIAGREGDVRIKAFLVLAEGAKRSEIEMRAFCSRALPRYMMPDAFQFMDALPQTSTDKVDYQRLRQDT